MMLNWMRLPKSSISADGTSTALSMYVSPILDSKHV